MMVNNGLMWGAFFFHCMVQKNEMKRKEKILKELEKKYEIEKNKTSKLDTNLKSTEEELKVTKKVQRNTKLVHNTE